MGLNSPLLKNKSSALLIFKYWPLLIRSTRADLKSRYAGSIIGIGWTILTPFVLLIIYSMVYLVIFQVRVPALTQIQYVMVIFSGLVPFLMTSEAITTSVSSIVSNKSVLSNTVFPVDLLSVKAVLSSQVTMMVGAVFTLTILALSGNLHWTAVFFPVIWFLHIMALIGLTWIFSLINLVFRDLGNIINLSMVVLMVLSPIAYTSDMVPQSLQLLILLNPLAHYVLSYQNVLVLGILPELINILFILIFSFSTFILGGIFFYRTKQVLIDYV
jgi:lipopolysaccharide transport system permease protein